MKFNKQISKLLAKLMLSSLAISSVGCVQTSAMEMSTGETIRNILNEILGTLDSQEKKENFIDVVDSAMTELIVHENGIRLINPTIPNFYPLLKNDCVRCLRQPFNTPIPVFLGIVMQKDITESEYEAVLPAIKKFFKRITEIGVWASDKKQYDMLMELHDMHDQIFPNTDFDDDYIEQDIEPFEPVIQPHIVDAFEKVPSNIEMESCIICLNTKENANRFLITPCKHKFHEDCLKNWLEQKGNCPICKRKITSDTVLYRTDK